MDEGGGTKIRSNTRNVKENGIAARPEWSSFCRHNVTAKKRERRAEKAAQIIGKNTKKEL